MAYAMATAMAMIARIPTTTYRVHGLPVQSSIPHRPLAARGESLASHRDGRGAPPARRDDREYREYLSEEQRSRRGCIARRMQPDFHHGLLELVKKYDVERRTRRTRRKTLSIFLCGFRGFCVVRDFFPDSSAERRSRSQQREQRERVHARAAGAHRPMQMWTGDASGRADAADDVARRHAVPLVHVDLRKMRQRREQSQSVVDHHGVP